MQNGGSLSTSAVDIASPRHCEPPQAAWQSLVRHSEIASGAARPRNDPIYHTTNSLTPQLSHDFN